MHTGTLKKWALALTFWLALHMASLKAQTIPFQLTAGSGGGAVDFEWRLDGSIIEEGGDATSTLSDADLESGTRFIWYPSLGALRAGEGNPSETVSEVGNCSVVFGYRSMATGAFSMSFGYYTTASGENSTAWGKFTGATGEFSTASGYATTASGNESTVFGLDTTASGFASTAWGRETTASGNYSMALGYYAQAQAYGSFALGKYNVGGGNTTSWVDTDPLFEIGNGTSSSAKADALVVYKNGNATVQGSVTAPVFITTAPGGDIPMYTGD